MKEDVKYTLNTDLFINKQQIDRIRQYGCFFLFLFVQKGEQNLKQSKNCNRNKQQNLYDSR